MIEPKSPEPWLCGSLTDVPPVQRAVLHALELAKEDLERWSSDLSYEELQARPGGIAPVAFHLKHIVGSSDRLLTYAEGKNLTAEQISFMKAELDGEFSRVALFEQLARHWEVAARRGPDLEPAGVFCNFVPSSSGFSIRTWSHGAQLGMPNPEIPTGNRPNPCRQALDTEPVRTDR